MSENSEVGLWVFGYGSLIWRPGIPYTQSHWAFVDDWSRRFWQASHDHRGTIDAPGRVLTLVPYQGERCEGRVFGVAQEDVSDVLDTLDYREKNGYERQQLSVVLNEGTTVTALTYIASPHNAAWLGDASDETIANQISGSRGPSGSNTDYVLELHKSLLSQGVNDKHIGAIANLLDHHIQ